MNTIKQHTMKKLGLAFIVLTIICTSVMAEETIKNNGYDNQDINTVFKREKRDGFYLSSSTGYSPINGDNAIVQSFRSCWIMDHWFSFGFAANGFVNNLENLDNYNYSSTQNSELNLGGGYVAAVLEPMVFPLKPIHLSFPILLGGGAAASFDNYYYSTYSENVDIFYVVEPGVELEVNFTKWLRIALYGTYRYTSDIKIENVATDALRSYSCGVTVKLGLF